MLAAPRRIKERSMADRDLASARTCYKHLAGKLGVALFDRLRGARALDLESDAVRLNRNGEALLRESGLIVEMDAGVLGLDGRTCVDWTERRFHLSGPLGTLLARRMLDERWLLRRNGTRAVGVSARGREGLRALGVEW